MLSSSPAMRWTSARMLISALRRRCQKISGAAVGQHSAHRMFGQSRPRLAQRGRRRSPAGLATCVSSGSPATATALTIGDTLFTVCPWWDGPLVKGAPRHAAPRGGGTAAAAMDLGASRAAGEFTDELGRQAVFWRCRTRAVDQGLPAVDGDLGPRASVALHPRRLLVRPARRPPGYSTPACSTAARRSASCSTSMRVRRSGLRPAKRNASTCARHCCGRRRRFKIRRPGSYPWVGLPMARSVPTDSRRGIALSGFSTASPSITRLGGAVRYAWPT